MRMSIVRGEDSNSWLKLLPAGNLTGEVLAPEAGCHCYVFQEGVSVVG